MIKNKVLYKLQTIDILSVAEDLGINKDQITPEVIKMVTNGWENALEWHDVTSIILQDYFL